MLHLHCFTNFTVILGDKHLHHVEVSCTLIVAHARWTNVAYATDRLFYIVRLRDMICRKLQRSTPNLISWNVEATFLTSQGPLPLKYLTLVTLPFSLSPAQSMMSGSHGGMFVILAPIFFLGRTCSPEAVQQALLQTAVIGSHTGLNALRERQLPFQS